MFLDVAMFSTSLLFTRFSPIASVVTLWFILLMTVFFLNPMITFEDLLLHICTSNSTCVILSNIGYRGGRGPWTKTSDTKTHRAVEPWKCSTANKLTFVTTMSYNCSVKRSQFSADSRISTREHVVKYFCFTT